eukprot:15360607-Ditylum_brightwellii.AAC.1
MAKSKSGPTWTASLYLFWTLVGVGKLNCLYTGAKRLTRGSILGVVQRKYLSEVYGHNWKRTVQFGGDL